MIDKVVLVLTTMTLGQIFLALMLLPSPDRQRRLVVPLISFLLAYAVVIAGPIAQFFGEPLQSIHIALTFPALLCLMPALRLYVEGLTHKDKHQSVTRYWVHYLPVLAGVLVTLLVLNLSAEQRDIMFFQNAELGTDYAQFVAMSVFALLLFWVGQCLYQVTQILMGLMRYRERLKDWFSDLTGRDLGWLHRFLVIAICTWVVSLLSFFLVSLAAENQVLQRLSATLSLLLVMTLVFFSLRQKPGLDDLDEVSDEKQELTENNSPEPVDMKSKYLRSALQDPQAQRIADKLQIIMQEQALYLDASLSLPKLADTMSVSANYISQTLNQKLNTTFFDYVNKWRIDAAKTQIIANQENILTIAMAVGFNARSSFYKAFKQETGMTPSQFRKHHLATEKREGTSE